MNQRKDTPSWRYPADWRFFRFDDRLLLIILGAVVGVIAGLAALALNMSLAALFHFFQSWRSHWWAWLIPAAGAALSALFLSKVTREEQGHCVPEVVDSVSRYGGRLQLRSSFSRLISSSLTIGSGGSAGPEAPVVISGASIGSNVARFFSLNDRQRVALLGCGTAGAIASIFNAPIAGLVFTIEVIIGQWSALSIVPIAVAAVAGAQVSRFFHGDQIAFTHLEFSVDSIDILGCLGLAVLAAGVSILLTRTLRYSHQVSHRISHRIRIPLWARAAVGGAMVGVIGMFLPDVLGEGYHVIAEIVENTFHEHMGIVALLVLAKIVATSFTLGWGGSGGIFAPCLVIGSFTGLLYHDVVSAVWPHASWAEGGFFALLGMAGLVSGILQAPLTGIFLIVEITGGYEVILPLILVTAVSTSACNAFEPASYYYRELVEKGHYRPPRSDARVLADISVREVLETDCLVVPRNMKLGDFIAIVQKSHRNYFPVVEESTGAFQGMIHFDDIREYIFDPLMHETVFLEQITDFKVETVSPDDDLADVLNTMDEKGLFSMPVVADGRFIGMISKATLLDKYRRELMVQT
jgi:chloride channel protein, CIC family